MKDLRHFSPALLLFLLLCSGPFTYSQTLLYLDPSSSSATPPDGSLERPFTTLPSAFSHLSGFLSSATSSTPPIILNFKSGIYSWNSPVALSLPSVPVNLILQTYSSPCNNSDSSTPCPPALIKLLNITGFKDSIEFHSPEGTPHNLTIQNFEFEFNSISSTESSSSLFKITAPSSTLTVFNLSLTPAAPKTDLRIMFLKFDCHHTSISSLSISNLTISSDLFRFHDMRANKSKATIDLHDITLSSLSWSVINPTTSSLLRTYDTKSISGSNITVVDSSGSAKIFTCTNSKSVLFKTFTFLNSPIALYDLSLIDSISIVNCSYSTSIGALSVTNSSNDSQKSKLLLSKSITSLIKATGFSDLLLDNLFISGLNVTDLSAVELTPNYDHSLSVRTVAEKSHIYPNYSLDIRNSTFLNNQLYLSHYDKVESLLKINCDYLQDQVSLNLSGLTFINNSLASIYVAGNSSSSSTFIISSTEAIVHLAQSTFSNNTASLGANNLYILCKNLTITSSKFYANLPTDWFPNNKSAQFASSAPVFHNLHLNATHLKVINSKFGSNYATYGGALRYFEPYSALNSLLTFSSLNNSSSLTGLNASLISKNSSSSGVFLQDVKASDATLTSANSTSKTSTSSPPVYNYTRSFILENNEFFMNYASKGGAVYCNATDLWHTLLVITNNKFYNNYALLRSPHLHLSSGYSSLQSNAFLMKKLQFQLNLTDVQAADSVDPKPYPSGTLFLQNLTTSHQLPYHFKFTLADSQNCEVEWPYSFLASYNIKVESSSLKTSLPSLLVSSPPLNNTAVNSSLTLTKPYLYAHPTSISSLSISIDSRSTGLRITEYKMRTEMNSIVPADLQCQLGYYYDFENHMCILCPPGSYNLLINSVLCEPCPPTADCSLGGASLNINHGFWRNISIPDAEIYECSIDREACLGGVLSKCEKGYTGPICGKCVDTFLFDETRSMFSKAGKKFSRFTRSSCMECGFENPADLLMELGGIVVGACVIVFALVLTLAPGNVMNLGEGGSAKRIRLILLFNVLFSYLMMLYVIQAFGVKYSRWLERLLDIIITPSYQLWGALMCYFRPMGKSIPYENIYYYNLVLSTKILLIILYFTSRHRLAATKKRLLYAGIVFCAMETVGIMDFLLSYVNCYFVGELWHPRVNMEAVCFDAVFDWYSYMVVYPLAMVFGILIPAVMSRMIVKGNYVDEEAEQRIKAFVLGRSDDFVMDELASKDWFVHYYESWAGMVLLWVANVWKGSQGKVVWFLVVWGSLVLLARSKKFSFFKDGRRNMYLIQRFVVFFTFVFGWIGRGSEGVSTDIVMIGNLLFIAVIVYSIAESIWFGRAREYKRMEEREQDDQKEEIEMQQNNEKNEGNPTF